MLHIFIVDTQVYWMYRTATKHLEQKKLNKLVGQRLIEVIANHMIFDMQRLLNVIMTLSSPPVAGVWWAHWRRYSVAAVPSSKWMLHTGGGWGDPPTHTHTWLWSALGVQQYTIKRYINASFIHSFIHKVCSHKNKSYCMWCNRHLLAIPFTESHSDETLYIHFKPDSSD